MIASLNTSLPKISGTFSTSLMGNILSRQILLGNRDNPQENPVKAPSITPYFHIIQLNCMQIFGKMQGVIVSKKERKGEKGFVHSSNSFFSELKNEIFCICILHFSFREHIISQEIQEYHWKDDGRDPVFLHDTFPAGA